MSVKRSARDAGFPSESAHNKLRRGYDDLDAAVRAKLRELQEKGLVREDDLDDRAYASLAQFAPSVALEVLERFASCPLNDVRNKSAYLNGVMNGYRKFEGNVPLSDEVNSQLAQLVKQGVLKFGQLDARCMDALARLPPRLALTVLERVESKQLADIRNMSAFFVSELRKVEKEYEGSDGYPRATAAENMQGAQQGAMSVPNTFYANVGPGIAPVLLPSNLLSQPLAGLYDQLGAFPSQLLSQSRGSAASFPGHFSGAAMQVVGSAPINSMAITFATKNYGLEQRALGVRTEEFHSLSPLAAFVHPAPALKLQSMWDEGNRLVSLLDERAWETLAQLAAPEGLAVIEEVANQLGRPNPLRNVNAYLVSVSRKYLDTKPKPLAELPILVRQPPNQPLPMSGPRPMQSARPVGREDKAQQLPPASYHGSQGPVQHVRGQHQEGFRAAGQLDSLSDRVRQALEEVFERKGSEVRREHIDEGVVDAMSKLSEFDALAVMHELQHNDMSMVRNVPAYIMGMCKRHRKK